MIRVLQVALLSIVLSIGGGGAHRVTAQTAEPLCTYLDAVDPAPPAESDPLAGRLGGTQHAFETRFGMAVSQDAVSAKHEIDGCGEVLLTLEEGIVTGIDFISPGFMSGDAAWTLNESEQIVARLLPLDVEQGEPFRNVSFVEHRPCFSPSLAAELPPVLYEFVDTDPIQGQCSAYYEFDDAGDVLTFGVQLQIEDPN